MTRAFKAVAFDGFTLFDPRPITAALERKYPGRGSQIADAWRARLFDYQWLRALGSQYVDFLHCAADSLRAVRAQMSLVLADDELEEFVEMYDRLDVWPDVPAALGELRRHGIQLAMLSNMTERTLQASLSRAGLSQLFAAVVSSDRVQTFKPNPRVYALAPRSLRLHQSEILFAPFAGWDAAGARWAGLPTFWVNRQHAGDECLSAAVDGAGESLSDLVSFVLGST